MSGTVYSTGSIYGHGTRYATVQVIRLTGTEPGCGGGDKDNAVEALESGQIKVLSKMILRNVSFMKQRRNAESKVKGFLESGDRHVRQKDTTRTCEIDTGHE